MKTRPSSKGLKPFSAFDLPRRIHTPYHIIPCGAWVAAATLWPIAGHTLIGWEQILEADQRSKERHSEHRAGRLLGPKSWRQCFKQYPQTTKANHGGARRGLKKKGSGTTSSTQRYFPRQEGEIWRCSQSTTATLNNGRSMHSRTIRRTRLPFEITGNTIWYDPLGFLVAVAFLFEMLPKSPAGHTAPLQIFRANYPFPFAK